MKLLGKAQVWRAASVPRASILESCTRLLCTRLLCICWPFTVGSHYSSSWDEEHDYPRNGHCSDGSNKFFLIREFLECDIIVFVMRWKESNFRPGYWMLPCRMDRNSEFILNKTLFVAANDTWSIPAPQCSPKHLNSAMSDYVSIKRKINYGKIMKN